MKKYKKIGLQGLLCLFVLLCGGCASVQEGEGTLVSPDETYEKQTDSAYGLTDQSARYEGEDDPQIITMYLTVGQGNEEDGTAHTWEEVNGYPLSWYDEQGIAPYRCEAVLQVGDDIGPVNGAFGYGQLAANASVRLKGEGASLRQQKSYRIDIKEGKGKWEEQKAIVLNKYAADPLRFKERLALKLAQQIPGLFSQRSRLVHLYVKDKTEGRDGLFEDYGLYTQVEQVNKAYLKNHGLDGDGALYEAENFDWQSHADALRLATDPAFSQEAFEAYLEIGGSDDHGGLLELLAAVNDEAEPIARIVETYFDADNLYSWLAFQILTGNRDTAYGNYCIYSPKSSDTWYFLPGSYDGMLKDTYRELRDLKWQASWNHGIFSWTGSVLFSRILQDETCREVLDEYVEKLYGTYLTEEKLLPIGESMAQAVKPYLYAMPDQMYARVTEEDYDYLVSELAEEVTRHYEEYQDSLYEPWPFHIRKPQKEQDGLRLSWEKAYLFENENVYYTVELAENYRFEDCLVKEDNVQKNSLLIDALPQGQYFLRVRAAIPSGANQDACEIYWAESGETIYSTMCFYVLQNGSIAVSEFEGEE